MRAPAPQIMRDVSGRLASGRDPGKVRAAMTPAPVQPCAGQDDRCAGQRYSGQHFDIFSREQGLRPAGWVVCWSDLMMTMFIMFAALYIFAVPTIQVKAVQDLPPRPQSSVGEPSPPRSAPGSILERVHDRLRDRIERDGLGQFFSVHLVPEKAVHLVLSGDAVFGSGGTALSDAAQSSLVSLGDILRSSPHMLAVVGHAVSGEPLGGQTGPWELSAARAASVAGILMRDAEIPSNRLLLAGYGDQRPAAGQAGPSASRRVELILCAETPTEPLQAPLVPAGDGFRGWLAASKQGEN